MVRETGLEPVRHKHTPLKRACLPIPALALNDMYYSISRAVCQLLFLKTQKHVRFCILPQKAGEKRSKTCYTACNRNMGGKHDDVHKNANMSPIGVILLAADDAGLTGAVV